MEKIKVCYRQIKAGTGADIWTYNTLKGLERHPVEGILDFYNKKYIAFPYLVKIHDVGECDINQCDIITGHKVRDNKPLILIEQHMFGDPITKKYTNILQKMNTKVLMKYEKKSLNNADIIICSSKYTEEGVKNLFGECYDTRVIYGGVDTKIFKPMKVDIKKDKTVLLFVGNTIKRKGFDLLPEIMKLLDDSFELWYTSDKKFFKDKRIIPIGRFKPNSEEMAELYSKADIFLFPSRLEGFAQCILEAMACGKPVITTDYSAMPEQIIDGKGGFLCRGDNVSEFAEKVKILAKDEALRNKMGKFNKDRIGKNFTTEILGDNYYKLYKELI